MPSPGLHAGAHTHVHTHIHSTHNQESDWHTSDITAPISAVTKEVSAVMPSREVVWPPCPKLYQGLVMVDLLPSPASVRLIPEDAFFVVEIPVSGIDVRVMPSWDDLRSLFLKDFRDWC